ncbi:MAG: transketolase [Bifidobacteriaceae bacterium]|jgi:transketolase|nr:transketolase [Bifidobacteriaceae bacterium]
MSQSLHWTNLDNEAVATAKALAADAVENAGSGHPGTAISLAGAAYLLFQRLMVHDPADPAWPGRDRFVLSAGHTSIMLYTQLYLAGYDVSLDDLKALRTAGSITPGHPEHGMTPGVEMSTGPLGQGLASAVGMAMAARRERYLFDPTDTDNDAHDAVRPAAAAPPVPHVPADSPFRHTIWVIAGEGDMEEGITSEASSLAGTQKLGDLVVLFDQNQISIEGDTNVAFTEDVVERYKAYGWHTQTVDWTQGGQYREDYEALYQALAAAKAETGRPSIVRLKSIIGWPAPNKQNTGAIHGSKLGAPEVAGLKRALGLDPDKTFNVPEEVLAITRQARERGAKAHIAWRAKLADWREQNPERAALWDRLSRGALPEGLEDALPDFPAGTSIATRAASGKVLSALGPVLPELWGGSADLAGSNNTTMDGATSFLPGNPGGRTIHFGIREHAMAAIMNGIALHGPTLPYGGTFLVFSDYMRGAVRLSALMGLPVTYVWTHDSIGVGEDGPTHQPIEQLASLRALPGLDVIRPADADETAWAWRHLLARRRPAALILSRQNLPVFDRLRDGLGAPRDLCGGAYVLADSPLPRLDVLLVATGSEVQLALGARDLLASEGIGARVVSAPCLEWFAEQTPEYREDVLPAAVKARVSVEAGIAMPWRGLVGDAGQCVSIETYGESASGAHLFAERGFTAEHVAEAARQSIAAARDR